MYNPVSLYHKSEPQHSWIIGSFSPYSQISPVKCIHIKLKHWAPSKFSVSRPLGWEYWVVHFIINTCWQPKGEQHSTNNKYAQSAKRPSTPSRDTVTWQRNAHHMIRSCQVGGLGLEWSRVKGSGARGDPHNDKTKRTWLIRLSRLTAALGLKHTHKISVVLFVNHPHPELRSKVLQLHPPFFSSVSLKDTHPKRSDKSVKTLSSE